MKQNTGASTPGKTRFVEQCWVLIGTNDEEACWRFRRRCKSSGETASVEAAWAWALRREEHFGDVIGFFHTHPPGASTQPSSRDVKTMRAWCSAFGKTLLCVIADGKELNAHLFIEPDVHPVPVESIHKGEQGWYTVRAKEATG
jgi:proteasome lid subunit RPN8/RPN11